jgi:hypothetical protein
MGRFIRPSFPCDLADARPTGSSRLEMWGSGGWMVAAKFFEKIPNPARDSTNA